MCVILLAIFPKSSLPTYTDIQYIFYIKAKKMKKKTKIHAQFFSH